MKQTSAFFLFLLLLVSVCAARAQVPEAVALKTAKTIVVDGTIDPSEWSGIKPIRVDRNTGLDTGGTAISDDSDLSYDLYLAHDGSTLYIAFNVNDEVIFTDSATNTWDDDCAEIFCDADEQGTAQDDDGRGFQLLVTSDARTDASDNAAIGLSGTDWRATKRTATGYSVEVALPFTSFDTGGGAPLVVGTKFGFTVNVDDDDDGTGREHQLWWYAVDGNSWNNQENWAYLTISEQPASIMSAGPDQRIYGGSRVTLRGVGPEDATSFTWTQTEGEEHLEPQLKPTPNQKEVYFDTSQVEIGFVLTFQLKVVSVSEGTATDTVDVAILASNPPKIAPGNFRLYPIDEGTTGPGFRLEWDPILDAEKYQIALKFDPLYWWLYTTTDSLYKRSGMNEGDELVVAVRGENKFCDLDPQSDPSKHGAQSVDVKYKAMRNLALPASLAGTSEPTSCLYAVKPTAPAGLNNMQLKDDVHSNNNLAKSEDYWGYMWSKPLYFDYIVYYAGQFTGNGGWFTSLKVQYTTDGSTWNDVPILKMTPAYDFSDTPAGRKNFTRYDITIPTLRGTGIRIFGAPGGASSYTSVSELEIFGDQTHGALIVQGIDGEFPEGGTVRLDGSYCFSTRGAITSYQWEKLSGPAVTILNPTSDIATFSAPAATEDTVMVFKLTAGDGVETLSDSDVRITIKNVKTTAVAGADRKVPDGSQVTLDGSGSMSTSGTFSYLWTQTAGTPVGVTGKTTETVTFTAPVLWDYTEKLTFQLKVDDGLSQPDSVSYDEVEIEVQNSLTSPTYPVAAGLFKDLLHLGKYPTDRILGPLNINGDPLAAFGGQAGVNPVEGDAYDFTGTGVTVSRNPMVWTPVHSANGLFGSEGLEEFEQIYHIYILCPEQRDARLHFRNDDELRIWNNGLLVATRDSYDVGVEQTQDFSLEKGLNSMTIKFEEGTGANYVGVGIRDRNDVAYNDLYYSFGPSFPLTDVYAVRQLPTCYQPGGTVPVSVGLRVNPASTITSVTITEDVPDGVPDANVSAPGGTVSNRDIYWTLNQPNVKTQTLTYSMTVPEGTTQGLDFAGTVSFGTTSGDIIGENVVYAVPTEPRYLVIEMLMASHLSWAPPVEEGVGSYNVFRSVNGTPWEQIGSTSGTTLVDSNVVAGSSYSYRVSAVSRTGVEGTEGPASDPAMLPGTMVVREAENFNYDGGKWPWIPAVTVPAIEAPSATDLGTPQDYDYFHANTDGPTTRTYRPLDNTADGAGVAIDVRGEADDPTVITTKIGWINVGSWYRFGFNVTQTGWIKLTFRVSVDGSGTIAAYWDETLIGTASYSSNSYDRYTWAAIEQFEESKTGEHHLRVQLVGGGLDFDKIAIGYNWTPSSRQTIWADNFDTYTTDAGVKAAGWTIVNGVNSEPEGAWRLWDTEGENLGNYAPNIAGMFDKYMITDSDLASYKAALDEELISKEVDCANYMKVRLNFAKNYNSYEDPLHLQKAEVDIRASSQGVWGDWVNLLHWERPAIVGVNATPEQADIASIADRKKIQLRWHFFDATFDMWFAIDQVRVSGEALPFEPKITKLTPTPEKKLTLIWGPAGANFTVQQTDALVGGTWVDVPGVTWPITTTTWTTGDLTSVKRRFYRIKAE